MADFQRSLAAAQRQGITLPASFQSTHGTGGLEGFPAKDIMGAPGTAVYAPVSGTLVYPHMIDWNLQDRVGGGTVYLQGDNGVTYFLTHFQNVPASGHVNAGQQLGAIAQVPNNWWPSHIHEGEHQGIYNPPGYSASDPGAGGSMVNVGTAYQTGMFTPGQVKFINQYAKQTGMNVGVVAAEVYNESNINTTGPGGARAREAAGDHDWLNIGRTDSGPKGANNPAWSDPIAAANLSASWIKGDRPLPGFGYATPGVQGILQSVGKSPAAQIAAIQHSGWAKSGYPLLPSVYQNVTGVAPQTTPQADNWGNAVGTGGTGGQPTVNFQPYWVKFPQVGAGSGFNFKQAINQVLRTRSAAPMTAAQKLPRPSYTPPSLASYDLKPAGDYDYSHMVNATQFSQ